MQDEKQADLDNPQQAETPIEENGVQSTEERIAELEAALEEAKASVLYTKAEGENIRTARMMILIKHANLR